MSCKCQQQQLSGFNLANGYFESNSFGTPEALGEGEAPAPDTSFSQDYAPRATWPKYVPWLAMGGIAYFLLKK